MNDIYRNYNRQHNRTSHLDYLFYSPIENYNRYREDFRNNYLNAEDQKKIDELSNNFYEAMENVLSMLSD